MASNDFFKRVGVLSDTNVTGDLKFRLAQWVGIDEAYQLIYREITPSDRFIPGERAEFTSDLDFREWSISDWSGGQRLHNRWDPEDGASSRLQSWYIGERGFPRVGPNVEITQTDSAADFGEGRNLALMFGNLYSRDNGDIVQWDATNEYWDVTGASVATGSSSRGLNFVAVGDDVYVPEVGGTVRKITDFLGTPSNASHVASGTWPVAGGMNPIVSYNGKLYGLNGNDLYDIDLTTADTLTKVADVGGGTNWRDQNNLDGGGSTNERLLGYALGASDKGPIWWVVNDDSGRIDVWEYNVAADTATRIGRLPATAGLPHQIGFGFGFVFVAFWDVRRRGRIWYKRAGVEGIVGPIPDRGGAAAKEIRGDEVVDIAGYIGGEMVVVHKGDLFAYDLGIGAWSHYGNVGTHDPVGANYTSNSIVFGPDVFVAGTEAATNKVNRIQFSDLNDTTTAADAILETGRWHFGYPNTYKTVAQVIVEIGHSGATGADQITVRGKMDNAAAWTTIGTIDDTEMGAPKTFTTSLRGFELDLQFELTGAATHTFGDYIDLERVYARAITAEARREWRLVVDASESSSAGHAINTEALYDKLDEFKESGNIISFTNPWDVRSVTTDVTYSRVRVADVIRPAVSESDSDQRQIVLTLREVDVIGRDVVA